MINRLTLIAFLLLTSFSVQAQDPEQADLDNLQQRLEEARQDLAAAAQHLARLQRELVQSAAAGHGWARQGEAGDLPFDLGLDERRIRHMVFTAFPPRLGILLGSPDSGEQNRVIGVTPGSGADEAGIREDDLVIEVGGQDVTEDTGARVREILDQHKPGDSIDVLIRRGDDTELLMPVEVGTALRNLSSLGERLAPMMEDIERGVIHVFPRGQTGDRSLEPTLSLAPRLAGLGRDTDLISNHAGLASYFGTDKGVLVLRIAADNPLNLESGDVILSIDGETVNRPVELGRILLKRQAGDQVILQIMRSGRPTEVYGTIAEPANRLLGMRFTRPESPPRPHSARTPAPRPTPL